MYEDDAALLNAVREQSASAFNILIDRHQQAVRIFLRGMMSDKEDAEDIAQETFLVAWTNASAFKGEASVRSWLFSIAWRKAKDSQRRWFRRRRRESAYHDLAATDLDLQLAAEDRQSVHQALARLPLEQRAAIMLCLGCGLTNSEAAEALNAPLGTIKSHILRGRAVLRESLGEK